MWNMFGVNEGVLEFISWVYGHAWQKNLGTTAFDCEKAAANTDSFQMMGGANILFVETYNMGSHFRQKFFMPNVFTVPV